MELATHSMVSSPNQRRLNGLVPESQPEPGQPGRDRNDLSGPPSTSTREQAPSFGYGVADVLVWRLHPGLPENPWRPGEEYSFYII